jgi:uncharacterized OsmC-like protein
MYKVEVTHINDLAFSVKAQEENFIIDAKGKGLTPLDALLSGLASCIGVYIRKYAEGAKLDLNKFKVKVEAELDKTPPVSFKRIDVAVDFNGTQLDERRKDALLRFVKNCPAHGTLKGNPEIDIKIF